MMAAKRKPVDQMAAKPENRAEPAQLEPGRAPSEAGIDQSPALALQAQLHSAIKPRTLELSTRFLTLFMVLTVLGTLFATEAAYTTL